MTSTPRTAPNILITGTPGVGKSTLCQRLAQMTGLQWLEISRLARENGCLEEYDPVYKCPVLDEDKLMDGLETVIATGGNVVDYHSAEMFPERWFDAVFVLRTDNTTLYDRLVGRGYEGKKLEDNIDCEIFQTVLEEAKASYNTNIVFEMSSSTAEELEANVVRICQWLEEWFKNNVK